MNIVKPSVEIKYPNSPGVMRDMLLLVEEGARVCYKTEGKMGKEPNAKFIRSKVDAGHLSVVEHSLITVKIICDRGVSHEIVRHRIGASYSQESTRYCNYSILGGGEFNDGITFIKPIFFEEGTQEYEDWYYGCLGSQTAYFRLMNSKRRKVTPQEARTVLNNSLKTEIMASFNFRSARHFLTLRTAKAAHPQMKEIAIPMLRDLTALAPVMFEDIKYDKEFAEQWNLY